MDRIPPVAFIVAAVVFVALGVWSALDENWSGLIVSALLAAACIGAYVQRSRA